MALMMFACAQQPATQSQAMTDSGTTAEVALPRVVFPDGYQVHVELATDDATRAQGLMYRGQLRDHWGMLFFFPEVSVHGFWMKNTLIPLDLIWIDEQRRVVAVRYEVPPCQADPCPSYDPGVPAKYVLEVAGGVARQHGIIDGTQLRFEGLDNVAVR
jgi:uncharacterized membrane protein (UPF0127 family)